MEGRCVPSMVRFSIRREKRPFLGIRGNRGKHRLEACWLSESSSIWRVSCGRGRSAPVRVPFRRHAPGRGGGAVCVTYVAGARGEPPYERRPLDVGPSGVPEQTILG